MKHVYYRNDFEFRFQIKGADGTAQVPQHRWSVVFSVGGASCECSVRNKTASVEGDTMVCRLQDHGFGCGELKAVLREWRPDDKWLDGYMDVSTPIDTDIELWEGASDGDIGIAVIQPSQGGSSAVRLPMITVTPSPVMEGDDGVIAPQNCLKVTGYEEYISQGYSPILMRKLAYGNSRCYIDENGEYFRESNYPKYGWRWRKTFDNTMEKKFIHLTINSDGLLCDQVGG